MRPLLFALSLALIAGCTPATVGTPLEGSSSSSSSVSVAPSGTLEVKLEKTLSEDELATIHTKAFLRLSGAVTQTIDLGDDIQGELVVVNPSAYGAYAAEGGTTVAVLTTWWAGQGEEIYVTQYKDPPAFTVEHRYGDEQGTCTSPELIADVELPAGDVKVELVGFEPTVEQSSLQFCHQE